MNFVMKYLILFTVVLFFVCCSQKRDPYRTPGVGNYNPKNSDRSNTNTSQNYRWSGSLNISNIELYRDFLQAHGICDRLTWNVGDAKCEKWDSTANVELIFKEDSLPSTIELKIAPQLETAVNPYFRPSQIIALEGDADYLSNQYGFQARLSRYLARSGAVGGFSIIVKSEDGTPDERILNMDIFYGGQAHRDVQIGTLNLENPSKPVSASDTQVTPGR